jgi:hypothetical protein
MAEFNSSKILRVEKLIGSIVVKDVDFIAIPYYLISEDAREKCTCFRENGILNKIS